MQEQLISLQTAKLADLKEFDWCYSDRMGCVFFDNNELIHSDVGMSGYIYCTTQSLMQRWLREKKLIDISVDGYWGKRGIKLYTSKICMSTFTEVRTLSFNSYEEALEEALQEALKLIK